MVCNTCGEQQKGATEDFTKAVIEINNPGTIVLLRKVVIPASMGTEEETPAAIGKYRNVILHYESNKHTYLYSSDGIPTLLEMDVPQELLDKIDALEEDLAQEITVREGMDEVLQDNIDAVAQDLEDFKNSPDVVDIVATYIDLQAYDTSSLGNNDVIRVLADETHDGASAYYRWDRTNNQWVFVGIAGPYYTKGEVDAAIREVEDDIDIVQAKIGKAKILSDTDYNWNSVNHNTTPPYDSVALWLLEPGMYVVPSGVNGYLAQRFLDGIWIRTDRRKLYQVATQGTYSKLIIAWEENHIANSSPMEAAVIYGVRIPSGSYAHMMRLNAPIADITPSTTAAEVETPLAASVGYNLNEKIGDLTALTTASKASAVAAINEIDDRTSFIKTLSQEDFNYPDANPDGVAIWKMQPGVYKATVKTYITAGYALSNDSIVIKLANPGNTLASLVITYGTETGGFGSWTRPRIWGVKDGGTLVESQDNLVLVRGDTYNGIPSSSLDPVYTKRPLAATQGKVLADRISALVVPGAGAPTVSTQGAIGSIYVDTTAQEAYVCVSNSNSNYIWKQITN